VADDVPNPVLVAMAVLVEASVIVAPTTSSSGEKQAPNVVVERAKMTFRDCG